MKTLVPGSPRPRKKRGLCEVILPLAAFPPKTWAFSLKPHHLPPPLASPLLCTHLCSCLTPAFLLASAPAQAPPLCLARLTPTYPPGGSKGFADQQTRMRCPQCLHLHPPSPFLTVLLSPVCPHLGQGAQVEGGALLLPLNPLHSAQSHHTKCSGDG